MADEPEVPLTEGERQALAALKQDVEPSPETGAAIVERLRARGAFRRPPRRWRTGLAAAAALVLAFLAGLLASRTGPEAPPGRGDAYLLLLLGGEEGPDPAAQVAEYAGWARALASEGKVLGGEKLAPEGVRLDAGVPAMALPVRPREDLGGFFIVTAGSAAEAEEIARSCPHLRYGGSIVIRRIEPT